MNISRLIAIPALAIGVTVGLTISPAFSLSQAKQMDTAAGSSTAMSAGHSVTSLGCVNSASPASPSKTETELVPETHGVKATVKATVLTFNDGSFERLAPASWSPATATDAELTYFSVPLKPSDLAALAQWTDEWVDHYSGFGEMDPCPPDVTRSAG